MIFSADLLKNTDSGLSRPEDFLTGLERMGIASETENSRIRIPCSRRDLLCFEGLLRTADAGLGLPFLPPDTEIPESQNGSIFEYLDIDVYSEHCLRLTARMAVNCRLEPSPGWLQEALLSCGKTPQNNFLDLAQWVQLETGMSLQLLDRRSLPDGCLLLQDLCTEENGSPVFTDGDSRILFSPSDSNRTLPADCRDLLILCSVTDSSGLPEDPMGTVPAVDRFCSLLQKSGCGQILDGTLDLLQYVPQPTTLPMPSEIPDALLNGLKTLGYTVTEEGLQGPSFREDIRTSEDLQAEIQQLQKALQL